MHPVFRRRWLFAIALTAAVFLVTTVPRMAAQGGEPQSFAIRGVTVVPVSGPRIENATVIVAHGVITAVGKDVTFPQETWVIDGKGLTVYPGLFDSLTDIGLVTSAPPAGGEGGGRPQPAISRGPEDRPGSTPWHDAAGEATLSDKRIEAWRGAGFTTVVSARKGGIFPGQGAVLDLDALTITHIERIPFPEPIRGLPMNLRESDPDQVVAATRDLLERLVRHAPDAAGVVMCSQLSSMAFTTAPVGPGVSIPPLIHVG